MDKEYLQRSEHCDCETTYKGIVYIPHGHVHTGNLDIIQNDKLRHIMKMGAKFRETQSCSITKIISDVEDSVNRLVRSLMYKTHLPIASFEPWKTAIMKLVKRQVRAHRNKANFTNYVLD